MGATARLGDRSFLLYFGTPVRGGGSIIVASDAKIFLGTVAWSPIPIARLFVTDPAGVVWADCETSKGCEVASSRNLLPSSFAAIAADPRLLVRAGHASVSSRRRPLCVSERLDRPTGVWLVTWLASTEALGRRERSLQVERIVLTMPLAARDRRGRRRRRDVPAASKGGDVVESRLQVAQALVRAEKLITVGVLSAGIAHELGSPLAVIRGRAESILEQSDGQPDAPPDDPPEPIGQHAEQMRVIIKHTDNISSKIRQLLDFSRRQSVARSPVALGLAIERARELVQAEARRQPSVRWWSEPQGMICRCSPPIRNSCNKSW